MLDVYKRQELKRMKDAYAQAVFTLQWNQKTEQNTEVLCQYKDVVMYHLFSRMESEMEPVSMQSEFYRELAVYDREHHTSYGRTVPVSYTHLVFITTVLNTTITALIVALILTIFPGLA